MRRRDSWPFADVTGNPARLVEIPPSACGVHLPLTREAQTVEKGASPLGPLWEGAPPAGGGGENCAAARLFILRPAALRGCPCTVCLPQGCGPGMPGPYVLRWAGFFLLAHFFIFFALLEYFSIILHKLVAFPVPSIL